MIRNVLVCMLAALLLTGCAYITKTNNEIEKPEKPVTTTETVQVTETDRESEETEQTVSETAAGMESVPEAADSESVKGESGSESTKGTEGNPGVGTEDDSKGSEADENITETKDSEDTAASESQIASTEVTLQPAGDKLDVNLLPSTGRDIVYEGLDAAKIQQIEEILDSFDKNISMAVYSTAGDKMLFYNTDQTYFSACTIKTAWMLYLCKGIDDGTYNKDELRTYQEHLYHQGSGIIRKGEYGDTYTIERLINLCMSVSDNVAYKMLREVIDKEAFRQYITDLGYNTFLVKDTSMWSSHAVVKDYIGIWNEVYKYLEGGSDGASILKNACTNTPFAYGVRTLEDADYSHKSGDNFGNSCAYHDAGLVWADTPYLYAVFSKCEGEEIYEEKIDSAMRIVHELFGGNIVDQQAAEATATE